MAVIKKTSRAAVRGTRSSARGSSSDGGREARSSRRASLRDNRTIRGDGSVSKLSASANRHSVNVKKRKAAISSATASPSAAAAAPDQAAPPERQPLIPKSSLKEPKSTSAPNHGPGSSPGAERGLSSPPLLDEKTTPTKKMTKHDCVPTGHKICRGGGGGDKITVPSSDDDSDYCDEKPPSDGTVDVPVTPLNEKKKGILSIQHDKARSDKRRMRLTMCGLVKPPHEIYDSIINFESLPPPFEEYKYVGDPPQWPPPSIMCCVRPPKDGNDKPLRAPKFTSYRMVSSCYPFSFQENFAIAYGEYLSSLFTLSGVVLFGLPNFCYLFE